MCFSPEVSFGSAAVLISTGMFSLWTAAKRAPRLWPLAIVPCIFGVQQACEGIVWLGLHCGDDALSSVAAKIYLFFALAFWPMWASASVAIIEPNPNRKRVLTVWAVASTAWFWLVYFPVMSGTINPVPHIEHHSIRYEYADTVFGGSLGPWVLRVAYVLTAAIPALFTSLWRSLLLPVVLGVVSAAVAVLVYEHAFTSVWCLFSAVLSVSLLHTIATAPKGATKFSGVGD